MTAARARTYALCRQCWLPYGVCVEDDERVSVVGVFGVCGHVTADGSDDFEDRGGSFHRKDLYLLPEHMTPHMDARLREQREAEAAERGEAPPASER